ncbi:MAG: recombinase-like helix-turn-helix domain-containing protein [Symbiopectobacterium sp.]|uniref:recombinase-like helix-turn-helix domain-containing protein n=1 Tax=Symbiopectobacterium sp. TaxID=2952789 RepID=UPI0039ECF464
MKADQEFNPALVQQQPAIPSIGGGNGCIHSPGDYRNLIWQSRNCVLDPWTLTFIAELETLFDQGIETLPALVERLNAAAMYDQQGQPWLEANLRTFLQEHGE